MDKNNLTYFSDSEEENDTNDSNYNSESDDSIDEETRRIVFENLKEHDYSSFQRKEETTKIKEKKIKKNNKMTLADLANKLEEPKKKKFVSKRAEEKKKGLGIASIEVRQFNPRKPPYNLVYHDKKTDNKLVFNENNFPAL